MPMQVGWVSPIGWGLAFAAVVGDGWRPFAKAREFVRGLGFGSQAEWNAYCRSGKKPNDIPAAPSQLYADDGWIDLAWTG
jgi:hypothetical protein